jgi:nanoRNase/pAp phosphatase (c-di-AMP/oligoRNAs hydrolase)
LAVESDSEISQRKLSHLLHTLENYRKLLILTHDNPDPDAISSAVALAYLLFHKVRMRAKVTYGGIIGRPENRAMISYLGLKLSPLKEKDLEIYESVALVDTQPRAGNNSLPRRKLARVVIDHHPSRRTTKAPFTDIRENYGATATILTEYLMASKLDVPSHLATALFYGIGSETQEMGREAQDADLKAYFTLFSKVNMKLLSRIRHPKVPREFFAYITRAIQNSFTSGNVIICRLGRVENPELIPQFADMFLSLERISWSMCIGRYGQEILLSLRTTNIKGRAGILLQKLVGKGGKAGGHGMIAGGQIDCGGLEEAEYQKLEEELIQHFLLLRKYREVGELKPLLTPTRDEKSSGGKVSQRTQDA